MRGVEYSLKAIPTMYGGVQMRSRLEARWAAFFDMCKWPWTYEPFDLNGWAPDFQLDFGRPVLVEVKPHTDRLLGAIFRDVTRPVVDQPASPRILLVGAAPRAEQIYEGHPLSVIGWGTDHETLRAGNDQIDRVLLAKCPQKHLGLVREFGHQTCFVCGSDLNWVHTRTSGSIHKTPWASACNATQWASSR